VRFRGLRLGLISVALFCALITASIYLFLEHRVALEIIKPTVIFALALPGILLMQFLQVQQEKAKLTQYFAPEVVRKLLNDPGILDAVDKKELSVLFSDIAGFTAWSSTREADEIHATLNRYFDEMAEIVFAHEGTIDKYMGDGLMVFFGDPVPQPDHALRAVRAACAMQKAARRLHQEWEQTGGMPIVIRIGVHTGEVVVGNMGSHSRLDYTVIGSNVNLAQRLESNCPPGGILISEQVYKRLEGKIEAEPAGTLQAKGFAERLTVYTVNPE
jgi:adenylate cyclase